MKNNSYRKIAFQGYSMYPFLLPGDILMVRGSRPEDLVPGNIIVYHDTRLKKNVAHRVVRTQPLRIKGDNLKVYDDINLFETDKIGKVISIERGGRIFTIDPFLSGCVAFLSRYNFTPGIIRSEILGRPFKFFMSKFRPSPPGTR